MSFDVIPSLDLLDGRVVRLRRGSFAECTVYGDPEEVLDSLDVRKGSRLHVVDLAGSRDGHPASLHIVSQLARRGLRIQAGGGARRLDDVRRWLEAGADKVVVGTIAGDDPDLLAQLDPGRVIPAVDVDAGSVRVAGWQRQSVRPLSAVLDAIERIGFEEVLMTDITRDGVLGGPSLALYRSMQRITRVRLIASGGVTTLGDVLSLARLPNVSGAVVGRALLDRRFTLAEAQARARSPRAIPPRIIPCLDVRDGRVVKGVKFAGIRDAGDPVECAKRYESEGADEIVVLDISASDRGSSTAVETVRCIADSIFIPLTVGGGIRTVSDFRAMLRAGADRVAINTAAVRRPELIAECAREFGVQAVVLSCDARRTIDPLIRPLATFSPMSSHGGEGILPNDARASTPSPPRADAGEKVAEGRMRGQSTYEVMIRGGKESTSLDAVAWCRRAEELGAGEILLTSIDRDGTSRGFDIDLLRRITGRVRINTIASGGAGRVEDFADAIEQGGATAALAASLFHDRKLTIGAVKKHLTDEGIPVR